MYDIYICIDVCVHATHYTGSAQDMYLHAYIYMYLYACMYMYMYVYVMSIPM